MKTEKQSSKRQEGGIYIFCFILLIFFGLLSVSVYTFAIASARSTNETIEVAKAQLVAESGFQYALGIAWDDYVDDSGGTPGSFEDYRTFLEANLGLVDGQSVPLDSNKFPSFAAGTLISVDVLRQDNGTSTDLLISSTGENGSSAITINGVYSVDGGDYSGFEFALLANNVNCIFCHAKIGSTDSFSGNPYERVKVSTLDSLLLREGSADSSIAGTLYTRGAVTDKSGATLDLSTMQSGTLDSVRFDSAGIVELDQFGNSIPESISQALPDSSGVLPAGENFYLDYPDDPALQTDGTIPDEFPAVFSDLNLNRIIDDSEYDAVASTATGTIRGGTIFGLAAGSVYASGSLPASSNTSEVNRDYTGNLILKGTATAPIEIDGKVVIDGDVVIAGVVKGSGAIYARGNVYVVADLVYADGANSSGDRTFGVAADGSENKLGLAAGGNIVIGDYVTPKSGDISNPADRTTGDSSGAYSFALSEIALFNRREWQVTQPTLPDQSGNQVTNSTYDSSYVPRYYVQQPGNPIQVFTGTPSNSVFWDPTTSSWKGKEHASNWTSGLSFVTPAAGTPPAITLAPSAGWISEATLKQIWINERAGHTSGEPFKVDGLLYSNNAIFALTRERSNSSGQLTVNGGIVASDVGILVAGDGNGGVGLRLNYDRRVADQLLDVKSLDSVKIKQKLFPAKITRTK